MATKNIVPRANNEGGLGTAAKNWNTAYVDQYYAGTGVYLENAKFLWGRNNADTAYQDLIGVSTGDNTLIRFESGKTINFQEGTTTVIEFGTGGVIKSSAITINEGDSGATPSTAADDLVIESTLNSGISILSPSAYDCFIDFGDVTNASAGRIRYDNPEGRMRFYAAGAEQLRLDTVNGKVDLFANELDASGSGVYLGAAAASNLLDDYEEGTFSPRIWNASTGGSGTTTGEGHYTKIGNMVHLSVAIFNINTTSMGTGAVYIRPVPFGVEALTSTHRYTNPAYTSGVTNLNSGPYASIVDGGDYIRLRNPNLTGGTDDTVNFGDLTDDVADIVFDIWYRTDE